MDNQKNNKNNSEIKIFKKINSLEAKKLIKKNKNNKNFVIIDVRTPDEHNESHIENSINYNLYDLDFKEKILKLDKNKTYLIYCRSGGRSNFVTQFMQQNEFRNIYEIQDGLLSW